jgi:hypothetical protein
VPFVLRSIWVRAEESHIAGCLSEVAAAFPAVDVGSYPGSDADGPVVRVTVEGKDADAVDRAVARLLERLPEASVQKSD